MKDRRAISSVMAKLIMAMVIAAMVIPASYWVGGLSSVFTRYERIEIKNAYVVYSGSEYIVTIEYVNTGSVSTSIDGISLNGVPHSSYSPECALGGDFGQLPSACKAGVANKGTIAFRAGTADHSANRLVDGVALTIALHITGGKNYPTTVTLQGGGNIDSTMQGGLSHISSSSSLEQNKTSMITTEASSQTTPYAITHSWFYLPSSVSTVMGLWGSYEGMTAPNQWHNDARFIIPPPWSSDYKQGMLSIPFSSCIVLADWQHAMSLNGYIPQVAKYRKAYVRLYWSDETASLSLSEALSRVDYLMDRMSPAVIDRIEAFIIGKDQHPEPVIIQRANDIYDHLKSIHPTAKFYVQYSSPDLAKLYYQSSMKGDGFLIYHYTIDYGSFKQLLSSYVNTGKPVLAVLWYCADGFEGGWLSYAWNYTADQLRACKDLGVLPFVFCYGGDNVPGTNTAYMAAPYSVDPQAIQRWDIACNESWKG
jgi:hypothetical protein